MRVKIGHFADRICRIFMSGRAPSAPYLTPNRPKVPLRHHVGRGRISQLRRGQKDKVVHLHGEARW
jgi:hypothetical protein